MKTSVPCEDPRCASKTKKNARVYDGIRWTVIWSLAGTLWPPNCHSATKKIVSPRWRCTGELLKLLGGCRWRPRQDFTLPLGRQKRRVGLEMSGSPPHDLDGFLHAETPSHQLAVHGRSSGPPESDPQSDSHSQICEAQAMMNEAG